MCSSALSAPRDSPEPHDVGTLCFLFALPKTLLSYCSRAPVRLGLQWSLLITPPHWTFCHRSRHIFSHSHYTACLPLMRHMITGVIKQPAKFLRGFEGSLRSTPLFTDPLSVDVAWNRCRSTTDDRQAGLKLKPWIFSHLALAWDAVALLSFSHCSFFTA